MRSGISPSHPTVKTARAAATARVERTLWTFSLRATILLLYALLVTFHHPGSARLVPFQLFMATLPFRAVATIAIRETAHIRRIKLERHELFRGRDEMGPPIPLPGRLIVPEDKRAFLPEADGIDPLGLDPGNHEEIPRDPGSPFPERQVVLAGTAL